MYDPVIFREYDVRGVYEKQFNLAFAENLGRAVVAFIAKRLGRSNVRLTIGNDARLSSPEIVAALSRGIRKSGGDVVLLGLVTTPMDYFSTFEVPDIDGSVMVTGSHNPPEYNGFKISVGKTTIFGADIQTLQKIVASRDFPTGTGSESSLDIFPIYIARYKKEFGDFGSLPLVLDCGNGAGGVVARRLYEAVGLKPKILFEEPDGRFPNHHPDPTVKENMRFLSAEVRKTKSMVGIGFDGDADRIGVVDEMGEMLYGDELIALCARFVLEKQRGAPIIGDVKCSDRMYAYIQKYGGNPIMWMTGHSLIKEKIRVEKAPFGGELSGHVFFADRNYGYDDALYAGLRVAEILAKTKKTIRQILCDLPSAYNTPEIRIDTSEEKKRSIVAALRKKYESAGKKDLKLNLIDGIRISFADGWALARASNTQPVLVLRFESSTPAGLKRISDEINSVVIPLLG